MSYIQRISTDIMFVNVKTLRCDWQDTMGRQFLLQKFMCLGKWFIPNGLLQGLTLSKERQRLKRKRVESILNISLVISQYTRLAHHLLLQVYHA